METKEELLAYVLKMRSRGDSYRSVVHFLESRTDNKEWIKEIIVKAETADKEQRKKDIKSGRLPSRSWLIGLLLVICGIGLTYFLWGKGYIAGISIVLVGAGFLGMTGVIK